MASKLRLTAAFGDYDRTNFLTKGQVVPEGIDLQVINMEPVELFYRQCKYSEFEISEMSMGAHCHLISSKESPFVGMPAFPSRAFRHSNIYYNVNSDIKIPQDLNGKRIALLEWGMTAPLWVIGMLSDEHGLELNSVEWMLSKPSRVPITFPENLNIKYIEKNKTLSDLLESGEIDAAFLHKVPECFQRGSKEVKRLFPEYKSSEIEYFNRTGVYPIMHCVVLRKDIYQKYPWALRSVYKALLKARKKTLKALWNNGAYATMIPFLPSVMEEMQKIFGHEIWPYGLSSNKTTLEKMIFYAKQQGVISRSLEVQELFGESVIDD